MFWVRVNVCIVVVCLWWGRVWRAPMCVWCICGGVCVVFVWSGFVVVFVCMLCVKCVFSVGCGCGLCVVFVYLCVMCDVM